MVKIKPIEPKFNWKKYKYLLLAAIVIITLIGIFNVQIRQLGSFLFGVTVDKTINLSKNEDQDFSILIMGIGGAGHEAPNLTDTIIYSNISIKDRRADLISIPRDLWIDSKKTKINAIYAYGKSEGKGLENAKAAVEEVVGKEINYVLIIDFKGFINLIDHLGGIEIDVEKSFEDYEYPITGKEDDPCGLNEEQIIDLSAQITTGSATEAEAFSCRYKTLSFEKGKQTMDGETALMYVRSRHGNNGEGSDFARSRRQQKTIEALKNKVLSLDVLLNPIKVVGAFNIIKDNITTDINTDKLDDFVKLAQKLKDGTIKSYVLDEGDESQNREGLLISAAREARYLYQYVLIPRIGNDSYSEIHQYVDCIYKGFVCEIVKSGIVTPTVLVPSLPDKR